MARQSRLCSPAVAAVGVRRIPSLLARRFGAPGAPLQTAVAVVGRLSLASMAREVLLPLPEYGGARPHRRKTQAEEEICGSRAQTPRQRAAQAESSSREQSCSAGGAASGDGGPDGKDAQIAPGRPASLGAKTARQGLSDGEGLLPVCAPFCRATYRRRTGTPVSR